MSARVADKPQAIELGPGVRHLMSMNHAGAVVFQLRKTDEAFADEGFA